MTVSEPGRLEHRAGAVRIPTVVLEFPDRSSGASTETDGVPGNDVLRRFRIVLDYSRRVMTLEANAALGEGFRR